MIRKAILTLAILALVGMNFTSVVRANPDGGYAGRPIWMRNGYKNAASFDGCFTDPTSPNPIDARVTTATVAAASNETTIIVAMAGSYILPAFAGCANPPNASQISTVKDSNNFAFSRVGGSLITWTGGSPFSVEVWASPAGGTGSASTGITVTYPSARLAHTFEAFVYRQVASIALAPIEKNESLAEGGNIWTKHFDSLRTVLAAVVTANQPATCAGAQPRCGYPAGTGPAPLGPNEGGKLTVPPGATDGSSGGGYHLIGASTFPEWGAFQVNVSQTGDRKFYWFLISPTPSKETFAGAFLTGPAPGGGSLGDDIAKSLAWLPTILITLVSFTIILLVVLAVLSMGSSAGRKYGKE